MCVLPVPTTKYTTCVVNQCRPSPQEAIDFDRLPLMLGSLDLASACEVNFSRSSAVRTHSSDAMLLAVW